MMRERVLTMGLGESKETFNLEKAVCNHGLFMMAPNRWNTSSKTLQRPLRLSDNASSVDVSISHSLYYPNFLYIRVFHGPQGLSYADIQAIYDQVRRMLRISEIDEMDLKEFHAVHPQAKECGFGRVFRSPSIFEDAVKSILLCNVKTLNMAESLCKLQQEISSNTLTGHKGIKRKRTDVTPKSRAREVKAQTTKGNFPTSKEIAELDHGYFLTRFQPLLGYRAKYVLGLAKAVESGKVRLDELEGARENATPYEQVRKIIMKIKGFGSFASANVLMCLGYYQTVPADSETIRHLKQVHKRETCSSKTIQKDVEQVYEKYAPFQSLAYWMELVEYYESKIGKLSELPESRYHSISGSTM